MTSRRTPTAWLAGLAAATTVLTTAAPAAHALNGDPATGAAYTAPAKIDTLGGQQGCSGVLVDSQWVLTATSCFADTPGAKVPAGKPKAKATATIGSTDLNAQAGQVREIVELVPRADRDVVMARLATPVASVTPMPLAATAPVKGEQLKAAGFGRTKDTWVPDRLNTGAFTISSVGDNTLGLGPAQNEARICKGDTGGPAVRERDGKLELAALNSRSWQAGCLGDDPAEKRTAATGTRVDGLGDWVRAIAFREGFGKAPWQYATQITSGYFTGGSAGGKRHMDMLVRWIDGEVTLYTGSDSTDPRYPFTRETRLAAPHSIWGKAQSITGADFTGNGTNGLVVKWVDGEVSQYTHVDDKGFHGEKRLAAPNELWKKHAQQITVGKYTPNSRRDDLMVVWSDGEVSLYPDLDSKGLARDTRLAAPNETWKHAQKITAGEFAGNGTGDLIVRWSDGETTLYPGVDTRGFHGETRLKAPNAQWKQADVLTAGAYVTNQRPDDMFVRWSGGKLSLFPTIDAKGLHQEIHLN